MPIKYYEEDFGTERQRISLRYLHFLNNRFNFLIKNLYWDNLELASLLGYYRYISLLITSALYLCGPPPSPFYLKAGVCFCLLLEAFLFIRFYNNEGGSTWGKKLFLFVETIGLAFVLTLTGGLTALSLVCHQPYPSAITLAPAYFCWALMGAFLCSALLQQFNIYGPEAVYVLAGSRLSGRYICPQHPGGSCLTFSSKLSRQKQIMEKQLQHIKSLYGAVGLFPQQRSPGNSQSFCFLQQGTDRGKEGDRLDRNRDGFRNREKELFVVRGPRRLPMKAALYIKKEFEKKQHAPEVNMQSFPGVKGKSLCPGYCAH